MDDYGLPTGPYNPLQSLFHDKDSPPGLFMSEWELGRINFLIGTLIMFAVLLPLPGAIAAAYTTPPWGYLLLVPSLLWIGVRERAVFSFWRWKRRVIRQGKGG
ncbi:MAG: hypothetical protein ACR2FG_04600 [Marmoricola sp.]